MKGNHAIQLFFCGYRELVIINLIIYSLTMDSLSPPLLLPLKEGGTFLLLYFPLTRDLRNGV